MTLDQIKVFMAVIDFGSLSAASEHLHKTKPAISKALKTLEDSLNLTLLSRDGYRLELTGDGKRLLPYFSALVLQQQRVSSYATSLSGDEEAQINLVYDCFCQLEGIFELASQTKHEYPQTELHITVDHHLKAFSRLLNGSADIAILPWFSNFNLIGNFKTKRLTSFKVIDVIHKDLFSTLKPKRKKLSLSELSKIPQVMPEPFEHGIDSDNIIGIAQSPLIRTGDVLTKKGIICAGGGWGALSTRLIQSQLSSGELVRLEIEDFQTEVEFEIHIVRNADKVMGKISEYVWDQFSNYNF